MAEPDKGFLGRWSQRKAALAQGKVLEEPVVQAPESAPQAVALPSAGQADAAPGTEMGAESPAPTPMLTLDDALQLTKDSDFKPYMAGNVSPGVRNAAMKKLFSDPQFNVMDGLDTYIDDYSVFEPIPESMLRQMVSAKFLNLFDDQEADQERGKGTLPGPAVAATDNGFPSAGDATADDPAPSAQAAVPALPSEPGSPISLAPTAAATPDDHDHSNLRL
ncbi:MAG: DUF3306 domain-containing protein [Polaromonas sp.]|nr:DUF3306 domain-containing protein [Polaromonas sp.]